MGSKAVHLAVSCPAVEPASLHGMFEAESRLHSNQRGSLAWNHQNYRCTPVRSPAHPNCTDGKLLVVSEQNEHSGRLLSLICGFHVKEVEVDGLNAVLQPWVNITTSLPCTKPNAVVSIAPAHACF